VTTIWTGFDQDRPWANESRAAHRGGAHLDYFMHDALAGAPRHWLPMPEGIVTARISPDTGKLASADNPNAIMEKFIEGSLPKAEAYEGPNNQNP
jgi:membrane carboxypeptidase/penicillin-binding protein